MGAHDSKAHVDGLNQSRVVESVVNAVQKGRPGVETGPQSSCNA